MTEQTSVLVSLDIPCFKKYVMHLHLLIAAIFAASVLPTIGLAQKPSGPAVGSLVQDFLLVDQLGKEQKLSALLADKPIALVVLRSAGW